MDENEYLSAAAIGHCAHEILHTEADAIVWGDTSKGLFAVTDNKKVLFITQQPFKGPLTVNIIEKLPGHPANPHGKRILLSPDQIRFNQSGLKIRINAHTHVWTPKVLNKMNFDINAFIERSELIECEMIDHLSSRASDFIKNYYGNIAFQDQAQENQTNITNDLLAAFSASDTTAVYESLANLLGRGEGLTPSGDDFICGFMLAAHAWVELLPPGFSLQKTIQKIVEAAREKTTALSANLISCAAFGSADERIIDCMQWLNHGGLSAALIMEELLSYGSSSGLDTLAGMLVFIQSSQKGHQLL